MEDKFADIGYEIIFVDDGSKDDTFKIADEFSDGNFKIIPHEKNLGKGGAVRTGMLAACGDVIFFTDCDLAYGLDIVKQGYDIFGENKTADVVIGSRRKHKDGFAAYTLLRKIMSHVFYAVLKIYGGLKQTDSQLGIKGFRNEAAKKIFGLCEINGWTFDFEVLMIADKSGLCVAEMPAKIINHRESKVRVIKDSVRALRDISKIKKRVKKLKF